MKVKYFITSILLAFTFSGCGVIISDDYDYDYNRLDRQNVKNIVGTVLRSQLIIEDASSKEPQNYAELDGHLSSIYDFDSYSKKLYIYSATNLLWLYEDGYRTILLKNMVYEYYDDSYDYHYTYNGTISNTIIGSVNFETVKEFYGVYRYSPYAGSLRITDNDGITIYLDVVDEYYIDITLYDEYENIDGIVYKMSWSDFGF